MSLVLYFIIATLVISIGVAMARRFARRLMDAHLERERQEFERRELAREQVRAEEAAWAAYAAECRAFWKAKLKTGVVLNFEADGRLTLAGKSIKSIDNMAHRHTLRRDVYQWCQQALVGKFEMVPFFHDQEREARIWFEDPNDAFQFKLRWY